MSEEEDVEGGHEVAAEEEPPPSAPPPPVRARDAVSLAFAVTIATGAVITYAFDPARAGDPSMIGSIGGLYAVLALVALVRLKRRGELYMRFRPVSGDMTLAAVTAGGLYGAGRIVQMAIAGHGSPHEAWIVRLYLQIGDTAAAGRGVVGAAVFAVAALEEIVWRGLTMRTLEDALGPRRALLYATLLFGLAHTPTVWLLRDPTVGLNPLLVLAALGCGLVWGAIVLRTNRLFPAVLAHALFSWSVVEFPLWRP
ncbi:MAG: CPBP family intramembrane metalloprotease [Minicystis sp.]